MHQHCALCCVKSNRSFICFAQDILKELLGICKSRFSEEFKYMKVVIHVVLRSLLSFLHSLGMNNSM